MADYRLALLYHPDSTHPSSSPHHFSLLNRAYKLLSSPHARALYHRTGLGWGTAHDVAAGRTGGAGGFNRASDEELRRQARARAYNYAYSGSGSSGGGAGYAGYANGRGGQSYDQARWGAGHEGPDGMGNPNPNGNYTTNTRFIGSLLIVVSISPGCDYQGTDFPFQSVLFSLIQYNRAINASLWTQEMLDAKHMGYVFLNPCRSLRADRHLAPHRPLQKQNKKPRCTAANDENGYAGSYAAEKSKGSSSEGWRKPRRGGRRPLLMGIRSMVVKALTWSLSLKSVMIR
jgi:hypothetical protein